MQEYVKSVHMINVNVDEVGPWVWTATDIGLWNITASEWPHLKAMWARHVKKYNVCVQAGGACGLYPRLLSETFGRVYTFEPDPLSFNCLVMNCQKDNIFKYNAAVGSKNELISLLRGNPQNVGENKVGVGDNNVLPTLMIDNLGLDVCDFIQLDVELYELNAIQGAEQTIRRCKPVISCENGTDEILAYLQTLAPYQAVETFRMDTVYKVV